MQVRSTTRHFIHLQFNNSANSLEIRAAQSPKCISDVLLPLRQLILVGIYVDTVTACLPIHLQFDITANALKIRAIQSSKCTVCCAVHCTQYLVNIVLNFSVNNILPLQTGRLGIITFHNISRNEEELDGRTVSALGVQSRKLSTGLNGHS
jgi:hypothetical protein